MGASALGRFLQTDPVSGGSATADDYCSANPNNCYDLKESGSGTGTIASNVDGGTTE
ncbi:hypothetical protein SAMN05216259_1315 [Actinacidiphila guanduensis]|uniref:Uncharacterized protein n=1 Tax=Actinacidiphila guanduensis TaxID=310781 RepID=A0A1H0SQG5_9ACTN|nr:hypothetical protein SAMN05216259_1315 [Actinacidiphila guanduensis]